MTESGRAAAFHHEQEALLRSEVHRPRKSERYKEKNYIQNELEAMAQFSRSGHTCLIC